MELIENSVSLASPYLYLAISLFLLGRPLVFFFLKLLFDFNNTNKLSLKDSQYSEANNTVNFPQSYLTRASEPCNTNQAAHENEIDCAINYDRRSMLAKNIKQLVNDYLNAGIVFIVFTLLVMTITLTTFSFLTKTILFSGKDSNKLILINSTQVYIVEPTRLNSEFHQITIQSSCRSERNQTELSDREYQSLCGLLQLRQVEFLSAEDYLVNFSALLIFNFVLLWMLSGVLMRVSNRFKATTLSVKHTFGEIKKELKMMRILSLFR